MQAYTDTYFDKLRGESRRSARVVVPLVLELVQPTSVVDVGCGVGAWLSVFRESGVEDILGVDGTYLDEGSLEIPRDRFLAHDLKRPLVLERRFDLVVSLEVAEHLPPASADVFVSSLTGLGSVILFSAAIPFQGGAHHVNEQWPQYWVTRFQERGYQAIDYLRAKIWQHDEVTWWYAQNMLLFARPDALERWSALKRASEASSSALLPLVHPGNYLSVVWKQRVLQAALDMVDLIQPGETVILVDQDQFGGTVAQGRRTLPFLEKDGRYAGPPPDDTTAVRELMRLRQAGASFIVFAWPAFWWLDFYAGLRGYLYSHTRCVFKSEDLIIFDLRAGADTGNKLN